MLLKENKTVFCNGLKIILLKHQPTKRTIVYMFRFLFFKITVQS